MNISNIEEYCTTLKDSIVIMNASFGTALDLVMDNPDKYYMSRPSWKPDVKIKVQLPDKNSKMTHPYLYVESRFGKVPWRETEVELFSTDWEVRVEMPIAKAESIKPEKIKPCSCKECSCEKRTIDSKLTNEDERYIKLIKSLMDIF